MDTLKCKQRTRLQGRQAGGRQIWKSQLSHQRRWLMETMHGLGHGEVVCVVVVDREPVIDPEPKTRPHRTLTGRRYRPRDLPSGDFIIKEQVADLFADFDHMVNGVVTIQVRDGLPSGIFDEPVGRP